MKRILLSLLLVSTFQFMQAQTRKTSVTGEEVSYKSADGTTLKGYVAFDENKKGKRPAIIVIPEWWGNNDYARFRADKLAQLGYVAIAADMYGNGKLGETPKEAGELAGPFYSNPSLAKERIEAAVAKIKEYAETDATQMACIGFCFGGSMSLNAAKLGMDFKGVVSFHGGLAGVPAEAGVTKAKILVCHGAADKFVPDAEIKSFRDNLDANKVTYSFISYPDATHAFTNPDATATGKKFSMPIEYNAAADKKSWEDMKAFFKTIF